MNSTFTEQGAAQEEANRESGLEDLKLISQARDGDRISFDRLVLKYRDRIVSFCVRMMNDFHEGEDAAQETFVKVYRNMGTFKGDSLFSTWLYRIAVNTCRNYHRSWWGRLRRSAYRLDKTTTGEDGHEQERELGDTRMLPSNEIERKELGSAIGAAIRKLPAIHRELVVLRDIQEKSYEEIALITGISPGTVKSRLARARASLQTELKGLYDQG